jgi:hypothetical protein
VKWGGWALREFLICTLLIYSPPPLSSPVNGEEGVWKDFLLFELLIYSPPPLSSPVKWGGRVKMIETDTPTFVLPRQWGGWNEKRLKMTPPPLSSPVNGEDGMKKD